MTAELQFVFFTHLKQDISDIIKNEKKIKEVITLVTNSTKYEIFTYNPEFPFKYWPVKYRKTGEIL